MHVFPWWVVRDHRDAVTALMARPSAFEADAASSRMPTGGVASAMGFAGSALSALERRRKETAYRNMRAEAVARFAEATREGPQEKSSANTERHGRTAVGELA